MSEFRFEAEGLDTMAPTGIRPIGGIELSWCSDPETPAGTQPARVRGQAVFSRSPAARSMSSRLSVCGTERACAVAATVTSHTVSIGLPSSTR